MGGPPRGAKNAVSRVGSSSRAFVAEDGVSDTGDCLVCDGAGGAAAGQSG